MNITHSEKHTFIAQDLYCICLQDMYSFNVGSLLEATTYLVRLQAISRAGSGQVASIQFRTPMLQSPPPLGQLLTPKSSQK